MKTLIKFIFIPSLFIVFFNYGSVLSQDKDWSPGNKYNRLFDAKTIVTLNGEITEVNKYYNDKGLSYGLHFDIKTGDELITVLVGPGWYIEDKGIEFNAGDQVEVTGSRVIFNEKQSIIATEIVKDSKTIKLRDDRGNPLWIGWGCR